MVLDTVHLKAESILAHLRELGSMAYCIAFGRITCSRQHGFESVLRQTPAPLLAEICVQSQSSGNER